jgi:hypothetical protein
VGIGFARVSNTVSTLLFGPFRGLCNSPLPGFYIGLAPLETRTINWFPIPFRKYCCALCEDRSRVFISFISLSLSCCPITPTSSGAYPTRSVVRKLPLVGISVSEPIGPSGDVHPAETDPVPPEKLSLPGALPDPAQMQSLASPLEVCEALIRDLESMFAGMSSYIEALESRVSSLETLLPQAQRAELQVVEALAGANAIEARLSLLEKAPPTRSSRFYTHRGSAVAAEEEG